MYLSLTSCPPILGREVEGSGERRPKGEGRRGESPLEKTPVDLPHPSDTLHIRSPFQTGPLSAGVFRSPLSTSEGSFVPVLLKEGRRVRLRLWKQP